MPSHRTRSLSEQISLWILLAAIAGAPLPYGSREPGTVAFWCGLLGIGVACAPVHRLRRPHYWILGGIGLIVAGYAFVLHEQLAERPWVASFHPIWAETAELLKMPVPPAVSIVRNEPFFALGAPLANVLMLTLALLVGTDRRDARLALEVTAWAGVGYAVYGLYSLIVDPTAILGREKTAYIGNLTGTFINRNTAATYFGSCTVVWFLFLLERVRRLLHQDSGERLGSGRLLRALAAGDPKERKDILVPFTMMFLCLTAVFLTVSRAGAALTLFVLALAFVVFFRRRLSRGRSLLVVGAGLAIVAVGLLQIMGGGVAARFEVQGLSDEGRIQAWRATLRIISDHPWFGTGLGTFAWAFPAYRSAEVSMWGVWDRAHSTPLELASEVGVPLALAVAIGWLVLLAILARGCWRRRRDRILPLAGLCVGLLAVLHSAIDFSLQVAGYAIVAFGVIGIGAAQAFTGGAPDSERSSEGAGG